jgi:drug/metabolite transporter (DMT)-like permease
MSSTSAVPNGSLPTPAGRPSLEVLAAAASAALLFSAFMALPLAGPMALPFAAVPGVRLAHRRGGLIALLAALLAAAAVGLLAWVSAGAREAGDAGLLAAATLMLPALLSAAVRKGLDPSRAYVGLCAAGFLALAVAVLARAPGADAAMGREIDQSVEDWLRVSSQPPRGPLDPDTAARLRATLEAVRGFSKRYWVGLIGACWTFGAAIAFFTGAWSGRPAPSAEATRFEALRIPAPAAALFVASGACWVLGGSAVTRIAGNLLWPLLALYFVGGLSIICHFARRWFRSRLLRISLYALAIYVVPINVGVALLGLFDWYGDFRRRGREIKES